MGWKRLLAWVAETQRRQREESSTNPDTWAGSERDPWWEEQRRKREQMRGRG